MNIAPNVFVDSVEYCRKLPFTLVKRAFLQFADRPSTQFIAWRNTVYAFLDVEVHRNP